MDKQDRLNRVENLFRNVPRRSWTDGKYVSQFVQGSIHTLPLVKYFVYFLKSFKFSRYICHMFLLVMLTAG